MSISSFRRSWANYVTPALITVVGAIFAIACILIVVIQFLLKLLVVPALLAVGFFAMVLDHEEKKPRHA